MPKGVYFRPLKPVVTVIGPSIAYVSLTQDKFSCIESDDAERVGQFNWQYRSSGYAFRWITQNGERTQEGLHAFILNSTNSAYVPDHKNHQTLDNRRNNLREASRTQNTQNSLLRKDNTSGFKGVYASRRGFVAQIRINKRLVHLGVFPSAETASAAYCGAAKLHFGEFCKF